MFKIKCHELTNKNCDFEVGGETREEVKAKFYAHGEVSPLHKEEYSSATDEEIESFSKKIDDYLAGESKI